MSGLEDRLVAIREATAGLGPMSRGLPARNAPRPGPLRSAVAWLGAMPGLRQTATAWLLRGAMMAYLLAVTMAFERILHVLQGWF